MVIDSVFPFGAGFHTLCSHRAVLLNGQVKTDLAQNSDITESLLNYISCSVSLKLLGNCVVVCACGMGVGGCRSVKKREKPEIAHTEYQ